MFTSLLFIVAICTATPRRTRHYAAANRILFRRQGIRLRGQQPDAACSAREYLATPVIFDIDAGRAARYFGSP